MARRFGSDHFDLMCEQDWVPGRRQVLGIKPLHILEPKEILGKLVCTLRSLKEGDGASYGIANQNFPEFRNANGRLIQRAFLSMNEKRRMLMDARYTFNRIPGLPVKVRAEALDLSVPSFWVEVMALKSYVEGFMQVAFIRDEYAPGTIDNKIHSEM